MGNGICHIGEVNGQELKRSHDKIQVNHLIDLPNSFAQSPSKPTIETQNPTISLNQDDCYDILLTSSLDMVHLDQDATSLKKYDYKGKTKISTLPILPELAKDSLNSGNLTELQLPHSSTIEPKPILKICEQLKSNQSKKKVRFNDDD
ncbi:unnamed protein product (macronuclear) [Paramecium tetraurelia]|uniref:Uncharacterized protein n=1 Tax=Paramecium tetraurelia TaxID=5888 RepID=A0CCA3_PARTE|nr:uncharacterized protein GSPATT00037205001 [Paramecium tetraurelia]CAK68420.1 unnamed protein product [Paramecium tetraurelia]|eukprot:XP_001435817.1 hypothetical protein (macronuclear) [Paramecium tetraurelia strain d4-2]